MPELWGLSMTPTSALAVASKLSDWPFALDSRVDDPPEDALGQTVALCSLGMIVGAAKLAGLVYTQKTDPRREHPEADRIRMSMKGSRSLEGPVVLVWEHGLPFGEPISIKAGAAVGLFFTLPEKIRPQLRAAYIAAKKRRES